MGELIDMMGMTFNRLTVIGKAPNDKRNHARWLCECSCGSKKPVITYGGNLRKGITKSCGCWVKEVVSAIGKSNKRYNKYDLTGEYGIGYTFRDKPFYFDLEDYNRIKDYCWGYSGIDGYITTSVNNKGICMHRLIMNCPSDMEVDHIYHVHHDNRKSQLRIVTSTQNMINKDLQSNNTSGVRGVSWNKNRQTWRAGLTYKLKTISKSFKFKKDAIAFRKMLEIKYFGEYTFKKNPQLNNIIKGE